MKSIPALAGIFLSTLKISRDFNSVIQIPRTIKPLTQALHWVQSNISAFNPVDPTEGILPLKVKALGDLSAACMVAHWYKNFLWADDLQQLITSVAAILQLPSLQSAILRQPFLFNVIISSYVCIEQCGISFPQMRILIQRLIDSGYVFSMEMPPYEKFGLYYFLNLAGYQVKEDFTDLYKEALLKQLTCFFYLRDSDLYPITHVLFYLSSFGRQNLDTMLGAQLAHVSALIELVLGIYVREKNWDLVGECLMCSWLLKQPPSPVTEAAWEGLLSAQHPEGYITGKSYDPLSPELAQAETAAAYIFKRNYHPTLVAIMVFSLYHAINIKNDTSISI